VITHDDKSTTGRPDELKRWLPGLGMVAIGLVLLVGQVTNSELAGVLIMPALAVIFIAWGIATREVGFFIPAGILSGTSLGTLSLMYDWPFGALEGDVDAGVFMLMFAGGWASITLLSALFTDKAHWWPLIPGAFMALIGGALIIGGSAKEALSLIGYLWPLALIVLGLYFMLRRYGAPEKTTGGKGAEK